MAGGGFTAAELDLQKIRKQKRKQEEEREGLRAQQQASWGGG